MCSSLPKLAHGLRDLSQAEKRLSKAEQILKMTLKLSWLNQFSEYSCHFVNLLSGTQMEEL